LYVWLWVQAPVLPKKRRRRKEHSVQETANCVNPGSWNSAIWHSLLSRRQKLWEYWLYCRTLLEKWDCVAHGAD
jgi:hypothetical protein